MLKSTYGRKRLMFLGKRELKMAIAHYWKQGEASSSFSFNEILAQDALSRDLSFKCGTKAACIFKPDSPHALATSPPVLQPTLHTALPSHSTPSLSSQRTRGCGNRESPKVWVHSSIQRVIQPGQLTVSCVRGGWSLSPKSLWIHLLCRLNSFCSLLIWLLFILLPDRVFIFFGFNVVLRLGPALASTT